MAKEKGPGTRCCNCGCRLDPGECCDCDQIESAKRSAEKAAKTRRIVEHNMRMMERAEMEFFYS